MYYISSRIRMNLPPILLKYMRELVKETRNGGAIIRKWIPIGRLIPDVLVESKLVETLQRLNVTKVIVTNVGKIFNKRNLKNMYLISKVIDPLEVMDMDEISSRRVSIDDYPIFTKMDPPEPTILH